MLVEPEALHACNPVLHPLTDTLFESMEPSVTDTLFELRLSALLQSVLQSLWSLDRAITISSTVGRSFLSQQQTLPPAPSATTSLPTLYAIS